MKKMSLPLLVALAWVVMGLAEARSGVSLFLGIARMRQFAFLWYGALTIVLGGVALALVQMAYGAAAVAFAIGLGLRRPWGRPGLEAINWLGLLSAILFSLHFTGTLLASDITDYLPLGGSLLVMGILITLLVVLLRALRSESLRRAISRPEIAPEPQWDAYSNPQEIRMAASLWILHGSLWAFFAPALLSQCRGSFDEAESNEIAAYTLIAMVGVFCGVALLLRRRWARPALLTLGALLVALLVAEFFSIAGRHSSQLSSAQFVISFFNWPLLFFAILLLNTRGTRKACERFE